MVPVRRRFGSVVAVSTIPAARAVHLLSACMPVEMGVARAPASEEIGAEASAERPRCAWSRPTQSAPRASTFLAVALIRAFSWFVQVAACCIVVRTRRCSLTRRLLSQQTLALSRRLLSADACRHAPLAITRRFLSAAEKERLRSYPFDPFVDIVAANMHTATDSRRVSHDAWADSRQCCRSGDHLHRTSPPGQQQPH